MARLPRKSSVISALGASSAPRIFSPSSLQAWLAQKDMGIPPRTLSVALMEWVESGAIERVNNRLYLNARAKPRPTLEEAAPLLRPAAVVSLQFALARVGVMNEQGDYITAAVSSQDTTKVGRVKTDGGLFRFATLPDEMMVRPGHPLFNDATEAARPWLASPEKALLDWLHLASTPRGAASWPLPAAYDWDLRLLNEDRLNRLSDGLGLTDILIDFQGKIGLGALNPSPRQRNRSPR